MQAQQAAAREDAALAFKRFILERSIDFESEPQADLYRVNLLAQMLDRYDELRAVGTSEELCLQRVRREFADIPERMAQAGFERAQRQTRAAGMRWPQLTEVEAEEYVAQANTHAHRMGIGTALCAACCAPLMVTAGLSELWWSLEDALMFMGLIGMFAMIGLGVYAFVTAEKPKLREQIRKGRFSLSSRLRSKLTRLQETVRKKARKRTATGIALITTCVIPILFGAMLGEIFGGYSMFPIMGVGGMFVMIGMGVYELVVGGGEKKAVAALLKEKDANKHR